MKILSGNPKIEIYNDDCLNVLKTMPDKSVDLVLTDPPFNLNKFEDDNKSLEKYKKFIKLIIKEFNRIIKNDGICFVCMASKDIRLTWQWFPSKSRIMAMVKNFNQYRPTTVQWSWTPIIFWEKIKSKIEPQAGKRDWILGNSAGMRKQGTSKDHPTIQPLGAMEYIIKNWSNENDLILDPFMGSGTTGVVCVNLNRNFIGIEISEKYCQIAEERIKAVLAQTKLF